MNAAPLTDTQAMQAVKRRAWRLSPGQLALPAALVVLIVLLSLASPVFLTPRNLQQLLIQGAVLAIVAVGLTFVVIAGGLDLSIGANVALAGVVASMGMTSLTQNVWLGVLLGILTGTAVGAVNGVLSAFVKVPPFIATLGTGVIVTGLALYVTSGLAVGGLPPEFHALSSTPILGLPSMVWIAAAVVVIGALVLHRTAFGAAVYATGGNHTAAYNAGISTAAVGFLTLLVAGFAGGLGGVLQTSYVLASQPSAGMTMTLFATAAVILGGTKITGGVGSMWSTLFGVLLITIVQNGLSILGVDYSLQQVAVGLVFVLAAALGVFRRS